MAKLKPCPFCGGEAMIEVIEPHTHTLATFMPDCEGRTFIECQCGAAISGETEFAAIAAWNRRTEENPQPLALAELHEMEGDPVYVKCLTAPELSCWGYREEDSVTGYHGNFFDDDYGTVWLAYRTRPERSGE